MDTQDVLGSQLLDLSLHGVQVRPQLVPLQDVLDHHRFKAWPDVTSGERVRLASGPWLAARS